MKAFRSRMSLSALMVILLVPLQVMAAPVVQLPKTGQTACWDADGNLTTCDSTGQDGDVQAGVAWPASRFIDNGDGTLSDQLTDLVWLKNADCNGVVTWEQALQNGALLSAGSCGLDDFSAAGTWRLPNRKELLSIMNFQQSNGEEWLASQGFINGIHGWYWSSDSYVPVPAAKWVVHSVGAAWPDNSSQITTREFHALYVRDPGIPVLRVSPGQVAFGAVETGVSSVPLQLVLQNAGNAPQVIISTTIAGADAEMFHVSPGTGEEGTCGTLSPSITAGTSCFLSLTFPPASPGERTAYLTILPQGGEPVSIPLSGSGNETVNGVTATVTGNNGTVYPLYTEVPRGGTAALNLTPAQGYRADAFVDGTCPAGSFAGTTYTTGAITADCSVIFSFVPRFFTVTTVSNGNGGVTCTPAETAEYLTPVTCTVLPAPGGEIAGVSIDGAAQRITTPTTFTHDFGPLAADHTITVEFAAGEPSVTVTPSMPEHGAITPQNPQVVQAGSTVVFSVIPASGYHTASVSGCSGVLDEEVFTTGPLTENCNLSATFEPDTLTDVVKAFHATLGLLRLTPLERHRYDVAPLGPEGIPQSDGLIDVGDVVVMLRRLAGLIDW